jgi:DNA-directed RNA polymerase subunit RPC12/RpoP
MLFLLSALQKAHEKKSPSKQIIPKFSQYDMEARHARRGVSCPSCDSRSYNLHVVTLDGEFKCNKCKASFKKEGT